MSPAVLPRTIHDGSTSAGRRGPLVESSAVSPDAAGRHAIRLDKTRPVVAHRACDRVKRALGLHLEQVSDYAGRFRAAAIHIQAKDWTHSLGRFRERSGGSGRAVLPSGTSPESPFNSLLVNGSHRGHFALRAILVVVSLSTLCRVANNASKPAVSKASPIR